jgi:hypothetical protein
MHARVTCSLGRVSRQPRITTSKAARRTRFISRTQALPDAETGSTALLARLERQFDDADRGALALPMAAR